MAIVVLKKNRFQSGFQDELFLMKISGFVFSIRIQTEQTVSRKKSGFRASPFNWTTIRGKYCRHPIAMMGVVDTFGLKRLSVSEAAQ